MTAGHRDNDRLDVPRTVPNRAERRARPAQVRVLPSADDGAMVGFLTRTRVRAVARSRVVSAALGAISRQVVPTGPTHRFYYGPTASDPDPGKMWHVGCGREVLLLDDGYICDCGAQWTENDASDGAS